MEVMDFIIAIVVFIIGFIFAYFLFQSRINTTEDRWRNEYERWKLDHTDKIRTESVNRSRSTLKGKIAEQIAPILPDFSFNPADARFIGSPIDFVIFDGYTDIKDDKTGNVSIVFLEVKKGKSKLTKEQRLIQQAVEDKRVRWETLVLNGDEELKS
jgi:predicted Holliday junction resolvase-like endonuclease